MLLYHCCGRVLAFRLVLGSVVVVARPCLRSPATVVRRDVHVHYMGCNSDDAGTRPLWRGSAS